MSEPIRIGVYICHCGRNIAGMVDVEDAAKYAGKLPDVAVSKTYKYMCSAPGQQLIQEDIRQNKLNRVVVASCSPLLHETTFRNATEGGGLNPFYMHMVNIREHVSWVHEDSGEATQKAKDLIRAAVGRVRHHTALEKKKVPVNPNVLVVGGGIAGIHAAITLANSGKKVYLVEKEPTIGGHMAQFDKTFPTLDCAACILTPKMMQVREHPNIELMAYSEVEGIDGFVGNYEVQIRKKARFVDEITCTGCGECTNVCPVDIPSEFDEGLGSRKAIFRSFPQAVPSTFTISRRGAPPCEAGCSIHQNAQGYVTLVAKGKFKEALDVILRDNPLPSICGRVCTHPCTTYCTRCNVDDPINVPGIKRFVTDYAGDYKLPKPKKERNEKIAIVGSGPGGLMAAYELRQKGYQTVIFETLPVAGGMLTVGIPEYRLPRDVLNKEIGRLKDIGVEIRTNSPVGKKITIEKLQKEYSAVFIAIGAHIERKLGVPGENLKGVWGGIEFLRKVNLEGPFKVGKKIIVIGGGNSALDAARTALRCDAKEVEIVYRRTRAEMPADEREICDAEAEGIKITYLAAPLEILGKDRVNGLKCQRMKLGEPDSSGRPRPVPIPGSEFTIDCDEMIATIGQVPDLASLGDKLGVKTTRWGTFDVDKLTLETNIPGVFAGGDCVTGPDVVVNAMYAGKKAAISIDRLINKQEMRLGRDQEGPYRAEYEIDTRGEAVKKQLLIPCLPPEIRKISFEEVHTGYTPEMAREEAKRCLNCGICSDCRLCESACEPKAINYFMKDKIEKVKVGTVILATGFKIFDAKRMPQYGHGRLPNVRTSLEIERMVNSSGPTGGEVKLENGEKPKSVGIIHCVGSRDKNTNRYCSRVCCMYSLKLAHLIKERTGAEVYNFYIDMRAPGKGYEEFYDKLLEEGVQFIRGRVAEVTDWTMTHEEEGKLVIRVEDTLAGFVRRIPVDMVVLSVGLEPREDAQDVRRMFNISCSTEGFFLERHPKLAPVDTFTDGIFIAGCCQAPKDIPDTVAQAGAAAGGALALVDKGHIELEPNTAFIIEEDCSGCKSCIPLCPYTAISFIEKKKKAEINEALCKGCGTCVASCPSSSIRQNLFQDDQIFSEIEEVLVYE